ncbi:uncharacterized protein LOC144440184 [Glandiceps talaboti]
MATPWLLISVLVAIGTTKVSSEFLIDPSVVKEGYDLVFLCNATTNETVRWLHNIEVISTNREVTLGSQTDNGRFAIVGDNSNQYNLQITDVTASEGGTYTCSFDDGDFIQKTVTVIDADEPTSGPLCLSSIELNDLHEGQNFSLICQSTGGDPKADLVWSRFGKDLVAMEIESNGKIEMDYNIILGPEYQAAKYTCTADHPSYDTPRSCEIGPLSINLEQRVFVTLAPKSLELRQRQGGTLQCSAQGNPPVTSYSWKYQGAKINRTDSRFHIDTNDNTLTIVSAQNSMDGGKLECVATNVVDTRSDEATITIVPTPVDEGPSFFFIAAIIGLILLLVVFVCCIVPLIAYCCYKRFLKEKIRKRELRKKQKKMAREAREAAGDPAMGINYYITSDDLGGHRRRRHRKKKSRVIKHNVVAPNHNGKSHGNTQQHENGGYLEPVNSRTDRSQSPIRSDRSRSLSPKRDPSKRGIDHQRSRSEDPKRSRRPDRVSLSPGEYSKRAEIENKRHEIEDLERSMTLPRHSRSRRKHRKKSRHSRHKRDESQENIYAEPL